MVEGVGRLCVGDVEVMIVCNNYSYVREILIDVWFVCI